jgi:5-methylcytosine-specific restriction endonuclease McrA
MRYRDHHDDKVLRMYVSALNRRAQAANITGSLSIPHLRGVILDSGGRCNWCGASVLGVEFEIDHILSVSRGGANTADNLALACPDCNRQKSDKHPARYAAEVLARGVKKSDFLERVMAQYGGDDPGAQLGLFDTPEPAQPSAPLTSLDNADTEDDTPPPPYVW